MKLYQKEIDGTTVIKLANKIIIAIDGMQYLNPSEEMILADGWVEYVEPVHVPTLAEKKTQKKEEITMYDSSRSVNEFYMKGYPVWLDKATRAGLKLRFEAEIATGKSDTVLWYEGSQFPLSLEQAMQMLYAIEVYASACYDNTQRHLAEVDKLETIEEVDAYDYRTGYPEKLRF